MAERIDLVDLELRGLTRLVLDPSRPEPFGVYVGSGDDPAAQVGREVERIVFGEAFGNTAAQLAEEYGPYEHASFFLCVVDHHRCLPAGAVRVIVSSDAGFKSLNDIEGVWRRPTAQVLADSGVDPDPERVWDIATLAVLADYRGKATSGLVSLAAYQAVTTSALNCGVERYVAIIDRAVLRLLQWQLCRLFTPFAGLAPMSYLGSASSVPVWSDLGPWERRMTEKDPTLHDLIFEGHGMEAALRGVDRSAVLDVVGRLASVRSAAH